MRQGRPLEVRFYRTEAGAEPVREWLRSLSEADRKAIGDDIRTMQFGWPLGMPLIRKLGLGLWEVRSRLHDRIARVLFTLFEGQAVLLHGFIKKSQEMPTRELEIAAHRLRQLTK